MKCKAEIEAHETDMSPPARGAWIEMPLTGRGSGSRSRRPPHGGRGLKSLIKAFSCAASIVAPRTGGVD